MAYALLLCSSLLGDEFSRPPTPGLDITACKPAAARADCDPDANVGLALRCEAHGMQADRLQHLLIALQAEPEQTTALGLLGVVSYQGDWQTPGAVARSGGIPANLLVC